nr:hypothetical protein Iba_chr13bCG3020 [Ipomoea batatas]
MATWRSWQQRKHPGKQVRDGSKVLQMLSGNSTGSLRIQEVRISKMCSFCPVIICTEWTIWTLFRAIGKAGQTLPFPLCQ